VCRWGGGEGGGGAGGGVMLGSVERRVQRYERFQEKVS
jgi:hypothetical protein